MASNPYYIPSQQYTSRKVPPYTGVFQEFNRLNALPKTRQNVYQTMPSDQETTFQRGIQKGLQEVRMHIPNILLMGAGTLLFPLLPKPFKMSLKHSLYMAPVHMAIMALINFGLGVYRGLSLPQETMPLKHH